MSDTSLSFDATTDPPGVEIRDPIEGRRLFFLTDDVPDLRSAPTEQFLFPVDDAWTVTTGSLRMDRMDHLAVWAADGSTNWPVHTHETRSFDAGRYQIEISAPIKLYLTVEGPFTVTAGLDYLDFSFEERTPVTIGARSYHERPAGTVTVGDDPEDAMVAISTFASSRKSTTPDLSFPTLRGHPPLVEVGDELHVPEGLSPPDAGISIEVPRSRRMIYPTAPLAFYLGASVEPGPTPRLTTSEGFEYPLDGERWVEDAVVKVLQQMLLFDGVVRGAGLHGSDLVEREVVEPLLDRDLATLYDLPMRERLAAYLSVSHDSVEEVGPRWAMTAYVPPTRDGAELLPYVVNELGIVRNPRGTRIEDREARKDIGVPDERSRMYVSRGEEERFLIRPDFFDDSVEHVWFGDHVPVGATKGTQEAFERTLERGAVTDPLDVAVVVNDDRNEDGTAGHVDAYDVRDDLEYNAETYVDVTVSRLHSILGAGYDVLHFVGETVPGGFVAVDGVLGTRDVNAVDVGVFLLEADHSFEEALWLARNGALGGVGTIGTVDRARALTMCQTVTRLLNMGFPLRGALDIARAEVGGGDKYVVVGNGSVDVAQPDSPIPVLARFEREGDDVFAANWQAYPNNTFGVGSVVWPSPSDAEPFLAAGDGHQTVTLSRDATRSQVEQSDAPTRVGGRLYWRTEDILAALSIR